MKTNKIQFEFCDFCEVTSENAHKKVADKKCNICGKWACTDKCKGVEDEYYTIRHFPYQAKNIPFVCKECWETARLCKDITKGVPDISAGGDSWSINLAKYAHLLAEKQAEIIGKSMLVEINRLVKLGAKSKKDKEKADLKRQLDELKREKLEGNWD